MNSEIKAAWIAALRSGKYKQGRLKLHHSKDNSYCCLGVLCDLFLKQRGIVNMEVADLETENGDSLPNNEVVEWAELDVRDPKIPLEGESLSSLNDNGSSFTQIAYLIEKYL